MTSLPIIQNIIFQEVYASEIMDSLWVRGTFAAWDKMPSALSYMVENIHKICCSSLVLYNTFLPQEESEFY